MSAKHPMWTAVTGIATAAALAIGLVGPASAQVQTQQSASEGTATQKVTVERGEVVWVSGNNLMVRDESNQLRYFPDVPSTARVTVGGKELSVTELKPGMKLERTTVVTTTPRTIRTVRTLTGTVFRTLPPNQVILTLANKERQLFTIPKDQKFLVDGKETDWAGLREGMRISASAVSETADDVVTKQVTTTGVAPPPPAPPPPNVAVLIIERQPAQAAATAPAPVATTGTPPAQLPRTGSPIPLIGLLGLALCGASAALHLMRRR
jgi:hypothetical protein